MLAIARTILGSVSVLCLLAGCRTIPDPIPDALSPDHVPFVSGQTGIIVGAVTSLPNSYGQWQEWSRYDIYSRNDSAIVGHLWSGSDDLYGRLIVPFAYRNYPDYKRCAQEPSLELECGRLFAMELPAGDYEIPQVSVSGLLIPLPDFRFTISTDRITYIGNLQSELCIIGVGGSNVIVAVSGAVKDDSIRDLPLLTAKYPFLANQPIGRDVIKAVPWQRRLRNKEPAYGWAVCERQRAIQAPGEH